jgi:hypothetical protein
MLVDSQKTGTVEAGEYFDVSFKLTKSNLAGSVLNRIDIYLEGRDEPLRVMAKSTLKSNVSLDCSTLEFDESGSPLEFCVRFDSIVLSEVVSASNALRLTPLTKKSDCWVFKAEPLFVSESCSDVIRIRYESAGVEDFRDIPLQVRNSREYRFFPREVGVSVTGGSFSGKVRLVSKTALTDEDLADISIEFKNGSGKGSVLVSSIKSRVAVIDFAAVDVSGDFDSAELLFRKNGKEFARCPIQVVASQ